MTTPFVYPDLPDSLNRTSRSPSATGTTTSTDTTDTSDAKPAARPPSKWRDQIKVHPAADLFPMMSEPELDALAAGITKNGLTQPVVFWGKPGLLIDGRNRIEAWVRAGIDEPIRHFHVDESVDPYDYVVSANIQRRHLTVEDKVKIAADLLVANPGKSDRQVAKTVKLSPTKVGKVRKKLEAAGDVSTVDTRTDSKGRKQPAKKAVGAPRAPQATLISTDNSRDDENPDGDEDPKGFVLAVIGNATEKVSIARRNLSPGFTNDERAEIAEAIFALIDKWQSLRSYILRRKPGLQKKRGKFSKDTASFTRLSELAPAETAVEESADARKRENAEADGAAS
jgi:ParB-like chromosome segregation protein Spo0J